MSNIADELSLARGRRLMRERDAEPVKVDKVNATLDEFVDMYRQDPQPVPELWSDLRDVDAPVLAMFLAAAIRRLAVRNG